MADLTIPKKSNGGKLGEMERQLRVWDWEQHIAAGHHSTHTDLLRSTYNKKVTENEWIKLWLALPREGLLHAANRRSKHRGFYNYRRLKENFGFFEGRDL